jgi:hypothetical protein
MTLPSPPQILPSGVIKTSLNDDSQVLLYPKQMLAPQKCVTNYTFHTLVEIEFS